MITFKTQKIHWNYYLAIEKDLEQLSRYVEFSKANLKTYSIELCHLLLSASSEVDVLMKQLCRFVKPNTRADNINDYRNIITSNIPCFVNEEINIDRFEMSYQPMIKWNEALNPNWWISHNQVKHERNLHFEEANLQNTVNAVGALLITAVYFYKYEFSKEAKRDVSFKETTDQLLPKSSLIKLKNEYY